VSWTFQFNVLFAIQNIENISFENLNRLPNSILEKIFSSPDLHVLNEDILFDLIIQLIITDSNWKCLSKTIYFAYVSQKMLDSFFEIFLAQDIDEDLFKSLKSWILCGIFPPKLSSHQYKWKQQPSTISRFEITGQNQKLKEENEQFKQEIDLLKNIPE
jgi:hypothetical protein